MPPTTEQAQLVRRGRRRSIGPYLFLLPWFIGLFAITLGPMIASLYLSFTDYSLLRPSEFVGVENYRKMLAEDDRFTSAAWVTLRYVVISVPLQLAFALALALLLNQGLKGLAFYRSIYYLPSLLGGSVAIAVLWRQIFGGNGMVNQILGLIGFTNLPSWVANPDFALGTLVTLNVWTFGSPMLIFLAGLRQVPLELYEAASVDGTNAWQRFVHITVPMLTPVVFFNLVLQMINAFQAFTQAYIVSGGSGGPADSTLFYTLYIYQRGFSDFEMGYASALAWVLLIVIALFTWVAFATSKHWVHYGGD